MGLPIAGDEVADRLLPGADARFRVVLFVRGGAADGDEARRRFGALPWPADWERLVIDLDRAPRVGAWFGIAESPAVAVVRRGQLLALEDDCTGEACDRLVRWAHAQRARQEAG